MNSSCTPVLPEAFLHSTDYFSSRDHDEGRASLVVHACDWHVLLPRLPAAHLPVPSSPSLPVSQSPSLQVSKSPSLQVSKSPSLQVFFKPWPGLPIHRTCPHGYAKRPARIATRRVAGGCWRACRLWLVRDTRHGEKPKALQRRLKRFRNRTP
ncbi:MAG TPA: hypothetical protein PLB55_20375 [Prosthecobacter sp.]|nr:hypothetical protein [Prosthecobacter sp.]